MESIITHTSLIIDFMDVEFDTDNISSTIKKEADGYLKKCTYNNIDDWKIQFIAVYNNGRKLLISKNKFGTLSSEKRKEITIVIPIPSVDISSWGIEKEKYIYNIDHYDKIITNFTSLEVFYHDFDNRADFIEDCLRRAVEYCFNAGITIKGNNVKLKIEKHIR